MIVHGTEGHLIPDLLAEEGGRDHRTLPGDRSKPELANQSLETPPSSSATASKRLSAPTIRRLPSSTSLCAPPWRSGAGWIRRALACITIRAAELAGVARWDPGPGKDADLTVTSSHPLNWLSQVRLVVMDGKVSSAVCNRAYPLFINFHKNSGNFQELWYNKTIGGDGLSLMCSAPPTYALGGERRQL